MSFDSALILDDIVAYSRSLDLLKSDLMLNVLYLGALRPHCLVGPTHLCARLLFQKNL